MVDITPLLGDGALIIQSFRHPYIILTDRDNQLQQEYQLPVFLHGMLCEQWYDSDDLAYIAGILQEKYIESITDSHLLIVGCGDKMVKMTGDVMRLWQQLPCAFDIMPTHAAIYSYNIVVGEGRNTAALFF